MESGQKIMGIETPRPKAAAALDGRRNILLVEDEAIIAMMLEELLIDLGYIPCGPAGTLEEAFDILNGNRVDGAILDIDLNGSSSVPVAERLRDMGVPFAFTSGSSAPPVGMAGAKHLEKPYSGEQIRRLLHGFFAD